MTIHRCDQCEKNSNEPYKHQILGYYPANASGILLPETYREFQFCSHNCMVDWMRWAITKESQ